MQKKYWLRSGIIGLIVSVIAIISYHFSPGSVTCVDPLPGANFNDPIFGCKTDFQRMITHPIAFFLTPTVVGLFLGWLYGKIKNRNKVIQ